MTIKTYFLSEDKTVYLKAYMLDNVEGLPFCEKRPGILILPGGGYEYCSAREGEPVAMHYLAEGYNAFVLIYSCNTRHPAPLLNASYAILKLRQRCEEFGIDPNKLAVWGYTRRSVVSRRTSVPMRQYSATLLSAERQIRTEARLTYCSARTQREMNFQSCLSKTV